MKVFKKNFLNFELLSKYKNNFRKIVWFFGKNAFLTIIILILINIFFSALLFYYFLLVNNSEVKIDNVIETKFKENIYQDVIKKIENREDNFNNIIK